MDYLHSMLNEGNKHYLDVEKRITKRLRSLPAGSVKARRISGAIYYYLQERVGDKVVHKYLGKEKPEALMKQISERRALQDELKKVRKGLKLVKKVRGRSDA